MTDYPPFHVLNSENRILIAEESNIEYQLSVVLPFSYYEKADEHYPCLFVVDSGIHQVLVSGITQLLYFSNYPDTIIVGVGPRSPQHLKKFSEWFPEAWNYRTRDLTPSLDLETAQNNKQWLGRDFEYGKAKNFLSFLKKETLPFVQHEYRVDSTELTLMGHSLGGLFVLFALFKEPGLFGNYVAASPSLHYGDNMMFQIEEEFSKKNKSLPIRLHLSVGMLEEYKEIGMVSNLLRFSQALLSRDYDGFKLEQNYIKDCDHNEVIPIAYLSAMKFLFKNSES